MGFDNLRKEVKNVVLEEEAQVQGWFARNKFVLIVSGLAFLIGFILGKLF